MRALLLSGFCLVGMAFLSGCGVPSTGAGNPVDAVITVKGADGKEIADVTLHLYPTSNAVSPAFFKLNGKPVEAKGLLPGKYIFYFNEIETGPQAAKSKTVLKTISPEMQSPKDTNTVEITGGPVTITAK